MDRGAEIAELLAFKKRWDRVEKELGRLRECNLLRPGLSARKKAEILLEIESGTYPKKAVGKIAPDFVMVPGEWEHVMFEMPTKRRRTKRALVIAILVAAFIWWLLR